MNLPKNPTLVVIAWLLLASAALGSWLLLSPRESTMDSSEMEAGKGVLTMAAEPVPSEERDGEASVSFPDLNDSESIHRNSTDLPTAVARLLEVLPEGPLGEGWGVAIGSLVTLGSEAEREMIRQVRAGATGHPLQAAAEVLARIGGADGIEALVVRLWTSDGEDRDIILRSFALVDSEEGINLLASAFSATDDPVILDSIGVNLARTATSDTVAFLREMYLEKGRVEGQQRRVLSAIELVGAPSAIPALMELLVDERNPELSLSASRALAKSGNVEGLIALVEAAERAIAHSGNQAAAAAALEGIAFFRGEAGLEMLRHLSESEDHSEPVSNAARRALAFDRQSDDLVEVGSGEESGDWIPRVPARVREKVGPRP